MSRLLTVCSGAGQRKHQISSSLAFVRGIHRSPVNSLHKGPVTRKMFPFDDVIISRDVLLPNWHQVMSHHHASRMWLWIVFHNIHTTLQSLNEVFFRKVWRLAILWFLRDFCESSSHAVRLWLTSSHTQLYQYCTQLYIVLPTEIS